MKSICFFCSYSTSTNIPNYIQYYIKELSKHFIQVVFITNEKKLTDTSLSFLKENKTELFFVENEGYDFGMWYKGMLQYNAEEFDRVGLVNDSCILFKPLNNYFDWLNKQNLDFAGMIDSNEIAYHIQSFFLTLNKKAILPALQLLNQHGFQNGREEVILTYELGLSEYLQKQGLKISSWFSCQRYMPIYNSSIYSAHEMIKDGYPLIKKKILFNSFTEDEYKTLIRYIFNHNPNFYISIIKEANKNIELFNFDLLKADGYNPDKKKIKSLHTAAYHYRLRNKITILKNKIYLKLKIRQINFRITYFLQKTKDKFSELSNKKEANINVKVAICLICKDENQYLQEWIGYHRSLGFTHFFIYDNNSKTPISETLANEKDCTITLWKDQELKQTKAYLDCCKTNKDYDWILFIDTDEFLILKKHKTVQEFLSNYNHFTAVALNWICYTGSGYENRVEWFKYNKYIPIDSDINKHIKSFVKPQYVKYVSLDPHKLTILTVNEHKDLVKGPLHKHSSDIAFIRHNVTRSKNEYFDKISRGRGDGAPSPHTVETFYHFEEQATQIEK